MSEPPLRQEVTVAATAEEVREELLALAKRMNDSPLADAKLDDYLQDTYGDLDKDRYNVMFGVGYEKRDPIAGSSRSYAHNISVEAISPQSCGCKALIAAGSKRLHLNARLVKEDLVPHFGITLYLSPA